MGDPTGERVEFASQAWIEAAGRIAAEIVAGGEFPGAQVTVCEVFHHPPADIAEGADPICWTLTVTPEGARAERGETKDAELRLEGEYEAALAGARTIRPADVGPPPERGPAAKLSADTRMFFRRLHNRLAEITL